MFMLDQISFFFLFFLTCILFFLLKLKVTRLSRWGAAMQQQQQEQPNFKEYYGKAVRQRFLPIGTLDPCHLLFLLI